MADILCSRCLSFNKRGKARCTVCNEKLHTQGLLSPRAAKPLHVSPFSIQEQQPRTWEEVLLSRRPGDRKLRYQVGLLAIFTLGTGSLFFHLGSAPPMIEPIVEPRPIVVPVPPVEPQPEFKARVVPVSVSPQPPGIAWEEMRTLTTPQPARNDTPSFSPFYHVFRGTVPSKVQAELSAAYERWKHEQTRGFSEEEMDSFMDLYAPDAQVRFISGELIPLGKLRFIVFETRRMGTYSSVFDAKKPSWTINSTNSNGQVELLARHRYSDDAGNFVLGQRRLVWEKRGDKWKIIEDDFPKLFN